jgi:hypothetical protein
MSNTGIEFEVNRRSSAGLWSSLNHRGIPSNEGDKFQLPIYRGPIVEYLGTLPMEFMYDFHIGCSSNGRHPSFYIVGPEEKRTHGELVLSYDRRLNGFGKVLYPRDNNAQNSWSKGTRNIDVLSKEFSNPLSYNEKFGLLWTIVEGGLAHNPKIFIEISGDKILRIDNFGDLFEERTSPKLAEDTRFENSPLNYRNHSGEAAETLKDRSPDGYQLAEIFTPEEFIQSFVRLFQPDLEGDLTALEGLTFATKAQLNQYWNRRFG